MTDWGDVIARVRGLSGAFLDAAEWNDLCASRSLDVLASQLVARGAMRGPAGGAATPLSIELALRRHAGARLRILARWAGSRATLLAPIFDDEDRRSLRALVRGAITASPAAERLRGLIATPTLPVRALEALAMAPDLRALHALLAVWRHPLAAALGSEAARARPDLFRLECALARGFADRDLAAAQRSDSPMRRFVTLTIDLENLWTALALAEGTFDADVGQFFVPGGALVTVDDLATAAETHSVVAVIAGLRPRTVRTPLAAALDASERSREDRALDALVAAFRRDALSEPLSTAPIIAFALRQRAELRNLLRITWGIALGATGHRLARAIGAAA